MLKLICLAAIAVAVFASHQTCTDDADCTDPCHSPGSTPVCHVTHHGGHGGHCHCAHSSTTNTTATHGHNHGKRSHHLVCVDDTECSGFCPVNGTSTCTTHPHGHNHCTCPHGHHTG